MGLQTQLKNNTVSAPARQRKPKCALKQACKHEPVIFTTFDGVALEIPDLPANLGRATALVSERTLGKIWGTDEEEMGCRAMLKEI